MWRAKDGRAICPEESRRTDDLTNTYDKYRSSEKERENWKYGVKCIVKESVQKRLERLIPFKEVISEKVFKREYLEQS